MKEQVYHELEPVYNADSEILILGTIPSPKSRQVGFYYSHPQNRFWKVISTILNEPLPQTIEDKKQLCLKHHIALWDVLASCEIVGASDSTIINPIPNDIKSLLQKTKIHTIITTGKKAHQLYQKYCYSITQKEAYCLPSTSPANCAVSLEKLTEEYRIIKNYRKND